jgi:transposase
MKLLESLEERIAEVTEELERRMDPFEWAAELLVTVPGIERKAARNLIAEIGADMQRFPSSRHLASWAGLCPGNHQSAGHNRSGKSHRGNRWIKAVMVEVAWAASRSKDTYCQALYRRLVPHRGKKRALVALANSLLQAVWFILSRRQSYRDLGGDHFEQLHREKTTQALVRRLERIGYRVTLEQAA